MGSQQLVIHDVGVLSACSIMPLSLPFLPLFPLPLPSFSHQGIRQNWAVPPSTLRADAIPVPAVACGRAERHGKRCGWKYISENTEERKVKGNDTSHFHWQTHLHQYHTYFYLMPVVEMIFASTRIISKRERMTINASNLLNLNAQELIFFNVFVEGVCVQKCHCETLFSPKTLFPPIFPFSLILVSLVLYFPLAVSVFSFFLPLKISSQTRPR